MGGKAYKIKPSLEASGKAGEAQVPAAPKAPRELYAQAPPHKRSSTTLRAPAQGRDTAGQGSMTTLIATGTPEMPCSPDHLQAGIGVR
jgi:hypothetical protein